MAEIRPIRAWRYNATLAQSIDSLTSPLFDVVSEKQRQVLYQDQNNSIHISVPLSGPPFDEAARRLAAWKQNGVIVQDKLPGIYVYYQYFKLAGSTKVFCRKGFIAHVRAYDWGEKEILRHENTMPRAVNDRVELLDKLQMHASPTHGLYTDEEHQLEKYMDEAILNPIYETEDYQGVRDVLAVIHDAKAIRQFMALMATKKVILADGHHRYEGSLMYRKQQTLANPNHTGNEGYNFHLMYFTNTEADDLRILPTHRLVHGLEGFDGGEIMKKFEEDFIIKPVEEADTINEVILGKKWAFGLLFKDRAVKVRLKPESFAKMKWAFPDVVKQLDLTVMHYFIIEKILGIPGKAQTTSDKLGFDRSFSDCLAKVIQSEVQMAIITQEISIEDVKAVCSSGYTMPQKSTYFYPKVICGFLFSSIKEDEFQTPPYSGFQ